MTLLLGAWTLGLILALLALSVYITFKVFSFADITVDGSFALGGAVAASLIANQDQMGPVLAALACAGWWGAPFAASALATLAGMAAGAVTGILHTKFKINGLLSGILVMTALYSINLRVMGRSNVPLLSQETLATFAENAAGRAIGGSELTILGHRVDAPELGPLIASALVAIAVVLVLYWFFRTSFGTALRAVGDNPKMIKALGVNTGASLTFGIALANGLAALSGALMAQYQGFADVQMGIGMIVLGLASVIIGDALVGARAGLGLTLVGAVLGCVLFRLLVAIALYVGLDPNDLKLITAVFVFVALIAPGVLAKRRGRRKEAGHA